MSRYKKRRCLISGWWAVFAVFFAAALFLELNTTRSFADEKLTMQVKDPADFFLRGNDYYEKGEYGRAVNEYEKILQMGLGSGPLYYNLGNAYFKSDEFGKAVLNYARASLYMPRDSDLRSNRNRALSKIKGIRPPGKGIWGFKPFKGYYGYFTVNEFSWISSAFFIAVLIILYTLFTGRSRSIYLKILLVAAVLALGGNVLITIHKARLQMKTAVVTTESAEVLYGPFDSATKFFTLHEGEKVLITSQKNGWRKIRRADGKKGWVKNGGIERVRR